MRRMMRGTYPENIRHRFMLELISMCSMMAAMAPVLVVLMMIRDLRAMLLAEPLFWTMMSLGMIDGFAIAFPVNVWMVARNKGRPDDDAAFPRRRPRAHQRRLTLGALFNVASALAC